MTDAPLLGRRALGRATLARQLLLERAPIGVVDAVERLAGMQAQEPRPPFIGLWSRLAGFDADRLRESLHTGALVRGPLFRATLHLVSASDWSLFRPATAPVLAAAAASRLGERADGIDLERVVAAARALVEERARTSGELRALLHAAFPDGDDRALGYTVRMHLPLTMVPSDDPWGFPRDAALALADPGPGGEGAAELVRRYLGAYGPASVADAQAWSGLPGLAPTFDALRGELARFTDERGRELFDLPEAPRPPAETPAPVRFLPEFDSLVLAHADRTRVISDADRPRLTTKNLRVNATVLLDGEVAATWSVARRARTATLTVVPFATLARATTAELVAEGEALLRVAEPAADRVSVVVAGS